MKFNSIKTQLIIPILIIFLLSSLVLIYILKNNSEKMIKMELSEKLNNSKDIIKYIIESEKNNLLLIAQTIGNDASVINAIINRDRDSLLNNKTVSNLNKKGIKIHFHLKPGISFLRVWSPNIYGDNLRTFRKTIVELYKSKEPIVGTEKGKKGIAIRALFPIFQNNKMIGSVEVFKTLEQIIKQVDPFKNFMYLIITRNPNKYSFFYKYKKILTNYVIITSNSKTLEKNISAGKENFNNNQWFFNNYMILRFKLFDIYRKPIATVFISKHSSKLDFRKDVVYSVSIIIVLTIFFFAFILNNLIQNKCIKPLKTVNKNISVIDFKGKIKKNIMIEKEPNNEIGALVKTFRKLLVKISDLFEFKETIEEDSSINEVFERIKFLLKEKLMVKDFSIYNVKNSKDKLELIYNTKEEEKGMWCSREILIEPNKCRAKRTAKIVDSAVDYPGICPYFRGGKNVKHLCIPIYFQESVNSIIQIIYDKDEKQEIEEKKKTVLVYLKEATPVLEAKQLMKSLKDTVMRDPLTGIYNRRFLEEYAEHLVKSIDRNKEIVGIIMIDLDHFKKVNDRFGHDVGDYVLKNVVDIFHNTIRRSDMAFRYGGEEFLIILHDVKSRENAYNIAEKLRVNVEQSDVKKLAIKLSNITISLGVSVFPKDTENFWESVKFADIALYKAKETGRNKVILFDDSMKEESVTEPKKEKK